MLLRLPVIGELFSDIGNSERPCRRRPIDLGTETMGVPSLIQEVDVQNCQSLAREYPNRPNRQQRNQTLRLRRNSEGAGIAERPDSFANLYRAEAGSDRVRQPESNLGNV